jgi:uncharacterized protein involved in response to NO
VSAHLTPLSAAVADLAFPAALVILLGHEIVAGRNWKNLPVLVLVSGWTLANALFHWEAAQGGAPAQGIGLRIGLAVAVMLISPTGGRIVPSFTHNWLAQRRAARLPVPFGRADGMVLALTGVTLAVWVLWPSGTLTALACGLAGLAHLWRLAHWQSQQTGDEALVWVLHAGYAFVPLGFLAAGLGHLISGLGPAAQHVWMAGAVGLMTLAVMTRASLGHAGRRLHATRPIALLYLALILSVLARLTAGLLPGADWPLHLATASWIAAFGGFAVICWPILSRPRKAAKRRPARQWNEGETGLMSGKSVHVVIGAGPLGQAVATHALRAGGRVRLVSRSGKAGIAGAENVTADVMDKDSARAVCEGADVVYQWAAPAYQHWPEAFPALQENVVQTTARAGAVLVAAENLYGYGVAGDLHEGLPLTATTRKGRTLAEMSRRLFQAHAAGEVWAVAGRASDFFGPGVRQSIMGERLWPALLKGKTVDWFGDPDMPHPCLIPRFDGAILSREWKEALWDKFVAAAPRPRSPSERQYSDRKLRSRS